MAASPGADGLLPVSWQSSGGCLTFWSSSRNRASRRYLRFWPTPSRTRNSFGRTLKPATPSGTPGSYAGELEECYLPFTFPAAGI